MFLDGFKKVAEKLKVMDTKAKDYDKKEDDFILKNRMKSMYWYRFRDMLITNTHPGFTYDEAQYLIKIHTSLTWSFLYGRHKEYGKFIKLKIVSSDPSIKKEFTTKNLISVRSIFNDYERIFDVKSKVGNFFLAVKKLYNQINSYCMVRNLDIEVFDTLVYDNDIYIKIGNPNGVYTVNFPNGNYSVKLVEINESFLNAHVDKFNLECGLKYPLFKMVARNSTGDGYDTYYVYEKENE